MVLRADKKTVIPRMESVGKRGLRPIAAGEIRDINPVRGEMFIDCESNTLELRSEERNELEWQSSS